MKLRVLANETAMLPFYEELHHPHGSVKRYVGWAYVPPPPDAKYDGHWETTGKVVEVPVIPETDPEFAALFSEYRIAVRDRSLMAADAETAKACGVEFVAKASPSAKSAAVQVSNAPVPKGIEASAVKAEG